MPKIAFKNIPISIDQVLRAQGMDPVLVRERSSKLIELTEEGICLGYEYLQPEAVYDSFEIDSIYHNKIVLSNGKCLTGELVGKILSHAEKVTLIVCTVGDQISEYILSLFSQKPALAMAVEGMAAAATEILGNHICSVIDEIATAEGLLSSIPINPGMIGWPVEEGQPQIFASLDTSSIGVILDPSGIMKPLKSLSMAIGVGKDMDKEGTICDHCSLNKTCTHKPG